MDKFIDRVLAPLAILLTVFALFWITDASAEPMEQDTVTIQYGQGGNVGTHLRNLYRWNSENTIVRIVGSCWSACTLYLAADNVCVYPSTSFHFHAPFIKRAHGGKYYLPTLTQQFYNTYPAHVVEWLHGRGGLGRDWLVFFGQHINTAAPYCDDVE